MFSLAKQDTFNPEQVTPSIVRQKTSRALSTYRWKKFRFFYQSSRRRWRVTTLNSGVDLELEQSAVATVKLKGTTLVLSDN